MYKFLSGILEDSQHWSNILEIFVQTINDLKNSILLQIYRKTVNTILQIYKNIIDNNNLLSEISDFDKSQSTFQ